MNEKYWRLSAFKRKIAELVNETKETTDEGFGAFKDAFNKELAPSRILEPSARGGLGTNPGADARLTADKPDGLEGRPT